MNHSLVAIPLMQLALSFIPVAITLAILFKWSLQVGNALYAVSRMLVQLLLIGYVLAYIFGAENGALPFGLHAMCFS